jgi:hypothetical protein
VWSVQHWPFWRLVGLVWGWRVWLFARGCLCEDEWMGGFPQRRQVGEPRWNWRGTLSSFPRSFSRPFISSASQFASLRFFCGQSNLHTTRPFFDFSKVESTSVWLCLGGAQFLCAYVLWYVGYGMYGYGEYVLVCMGMVCTISYGYSYGMSGMSGFGKIHMYGMRMYGMYLCMY